MASQNKSIWIVVALVAAGAVVLLLSFKPNKSVAQKVVMQEVLEQQPAAVAANNDDTQRDPVPSPAIVTTPEHGKEAGFAVQVSSFQDQNRAATSVTNLKNSGYAAYMEMSDLGERGTWYRVRIGGLANEAEAKAVLEEIHKNFKDFDKKNFILKPKN